MQSSGGSICGRCIFGLGEETLRVWQGPDLDAFFGHFPFRRRPGGLVCTNPRDPVAPDGTPYGEDCAYADAGEGIRMAPCAACETWTPVACQDEDAVCGHCVGTEAHCLTSCTGGELKEQCPYRQRLQTRGVPLVQEGPTGTRIIGALRPRDLGS